MENHSPFIQTPPLTYFLSQFPYERHPDIGGPSGPPVPCALTRTGREAHRRLVRKSYSIENVFCKLVAIIASLETVTFLKKIKRAIENEPL